MYFVPVIVLGNGDSGQIKKDPVWNKIHWPIDVIIKVKVIYNRKKKRLILPFSDIKLYIREEKFCQAT